jgi:tyrosyl-tRNA synthetase
MKVDTDIKKINEILTRGVEKIIIKESLLKKLKSGKRLRIKHGIDPTGPKIHLGRAIQFWKLKSFQDLGHQIVLILGDFTAQIGDASDKQSMRRPLSEKEVKENLKDYKKQINKILDLKKTEIRYNSEWLKKLKITDLIKLEMKFTAQQMIQRRNFKERWERGLPIGLHELNYPLFQGYDSVMVKADVEIGGYDQLFNLTIGREIQKIFHQRPQDIMVSEMLYGLDGRKMSTSWGNVINILDPPQEMYGKIMSMKDELIVSYFKLCVPTVSLDEIKEIEKKLLNKEVNPKDIKARLAKEIIKLYHSEKEAVEAEEEFNRIFKEKKLPKEMKEAKIKEKEMNILDLLVKTNMVSSKSEGRRLLLQKAVEIDNNLKTDWKEKIQLKDGMVIRVGKRNFRKVKLIS